MDSEYNKQTNMPLYDLDLKKILQLSEYMPTLCILKYTVNVVLNCCLENTFRVLVQWATVALWKRNCVMVADLLKDKETNILKLRLIYISKAFRNSSVILPNEIKVRL